MQTELKSAEHKQNNRMNSEISSSLRHHNTITSHSNQPQTHLAMSRTLHTHFTRHLTRTSNPLQTNLNLPSTQPQTQPPSHRASKDRSYDPAPHTDSDSDSEVDRESIAPEEFGLAVRYVPTCEYESRPMGRRRSLWRRICRRVGWGP